MEAGDPTVLSVRLSELEGENRRLRRELESAQRTEWSCHELNNIRQHFDMFMDKVYQIEIGVTEDRDPHMRVMRTLSEFADLREAYGKLKTDFEAVKAERDSYVREAEATLDLYREQGRVTVCRDGNTVQRAFASAEIAVQKAERLLESACIRLGAAIRETWGEAVCTDKSVLVDVPDRCPITELPFFMMIEHPEVRGLRVPTYGGPLDSYTIPERDEDGDWVAMRYDHDEGGWVEGSFVTGLKVVPDELLVLWEGFFEDTPDPDKLDLLARWLDEKFPNDQKPEVQADLRAWAEAIRTLRQRVPAFPAKAEVA